MRYVRCLSDRSCPRWLSCCLDIKTRVTIIMCWRRHRVVPLANAEFLDDRLPYSR